MDNDIVKVDSEKVSFSPSSMNEMRKQLITEYHKGHSSLAQRLNAEGKNNIEQMVMALVDEVIGETDNLKGNELMAMEEGNLQTASVISYKRAEVLEKAIKAVQTKQQFDKEHGIDIESPAMRIVFGFFMSKVKQSFERLETQSEEVDLFFKTLGTSMENWKDELQAELDDLNRLNAE